MRKETTNGKQPLRHSSLVAAAAVLAVVLIGLAWYALATPVQVEKKVVKQVLKQDITFAHTAIPKPCALYPSPEPLSGQNVYFTKVVDSFKVHIKAAIASDPPAAVTGTSKVLLQLRAEDLWEREYVLAPEQPFAGSGTFTVVDNTFDVPLREILVFTKQVEEETEVYPRDGYTLAVIPVIKAGVREADGTLQNDFTPAFTFKTTQRELRPEGEVRQQKSTELTAVAAVPATVNILGLALPAATARCVFGFAAVLATGLATWLAYVYLKSRQPPSEVERIGRRHRGRIVRALPGTQVSGAIVPLNSFKELLRLADEREKSIICLERLEGGRRICRYCLPDGGTVYCYTATDEAPGEKTRHLKERAKMREETATKPVQS